MTLILSGTDGLSDIDGSASTPAIRGTDANTGIFFPAADTIAFSEGGAEAMRIDSSGNVGIGTSSPLSRLQVSSQSRLGSAAGSAFSGTLATGGVDVMCGSGSQAFQVWDDNSLATPRFIVQRDGNAVWNGTNTTTQNGNVGYVYKFFGGNNNLVMPMEVGIGDRYAILEFRQTGRTNSARASQISIGQNSLNQGDVQVYSSNANADISGGVRLSNGATSWSAISDMRLKTVTGTYTNALQDIAKIQAIKFTWKHDQSGTPQVGVSAQSVQLVVPEAVSTSRNIATPDDETEYLSVRYTELIPLMIASIQEQQAMIVALKAEVDALKGA
jgi:hypothetical protein